MSTVAWAVLAVVVRRSIRLQVHGGVVREAALGMGSEEALRHRQRPVSAHVQIGDQALAELQSRSLGHVGAREACEAQHSTALGYYITDYALTGLVSLPTEQPHLEWHAWSACTDPVAG